MHIQLNKTYLGISLNNLVLLVLLYTTLIIVSNNINFNTLTLTSNRYVLYAEKKIQYHLKLCVYTEITKV